MTATSDALDSGLLQFSTGAVIGTGGLIETPNQRLGIRNVLPIVTPADLAKVPVTTEGAKGPVRLGDVAPRAEDHQPLIGDAVINGEPGLLLVVEKLPWANTLQVTARRRAGDQGPAAGPARHPVRHQRSSGRPPSSRSRSHNLTQALLLGFLLVVRDPGAVPVRVAQSR